ncbi:hypothetical protein RJ641_028559 [Dillenia turbinata]|uniref:Kinetochore protein Spc24 n=1 Tax=Dillenia turbinata TaxID=194707 RepID=A0AAN8WC75_9MAGN
MGEISRNVDFENLISYGDDLVELLKDKKDLNNLTRCVENSKSLRLNCDADIDEIHSLIQGYEQKIDACKRKIDEAKSEVVSDAEISFLEKELDEEMEREPVVDEISDLEHHSVSVEERKKIQKKVKQEEQRLKTMLSIYASVTNIIPNLDDQMSISGHIVEKNKKVVEMFEFDPANVSDFNLCNEIWKMISM